jgi:trichohyalin
MSGIIETNNLKASNHGGDASPNYDEAMDSSLTGLPNTSAGHKLKSVTAELEKRRAELIALARQAEIRAREAEEKCEQIESKLEQEANQRLQAEQRLRDLEEERLRQLQAAEIESVKTLKTALEQERQEMGARLNEAEAQIEEAESKAATLTFALAEAERKRTEAEALAQVARDDAREIESLFAGAEARLKEVESLSMETEARMREESEARRFAEKALLEAQGKDEAAAQAMAKAEATSIALAEANQRRAAAEAAAQSAEEKCGQVEYRLTQEMDQRALLEQRIRELEEKFWDQQRARETRELEINDVLLAREQAEARLREVETRLLEAGNTAFALTEANQRRAEAEAAVRNSEENARTLEALLMEAEAAAHEATERHNAAETRLQYEIKQRAQAEQKLKEFEDELSNYLELDWSTKGESEAPQAVAAHDGFVPDENTSELLAQVEIERKARQEAEEARANFEMRMWEMERELRNAEERRRQQEDEIRELHRKQEMKQSSPPEWKAVGESRFTTAGMAKSAAQDHAYSLKKQKGVGYEFRFIVYGIVITALLVAAGWLITELFLRA